MSFFKKLFNKKEEVKSFANDVICEHCDKLIQPYEKRKKFDGKRYHVKCFKKMKKTSKM